MSWKSIMAFIQTADFCAQSAHFAWGWAVPLAASHWLGWWAAPAFLLLWSAPKELIFDQFGFGEGHGSPDWLDLTFYTFGELAFCLTLYLWSR